MASGPRRLDPHQEARVTTDTLKIYRKAGLAFALWSQNNHLSLTTADRWDDALVEYKNAVVLSKSQFANTVASVEMFFPRYKGKLRWAHAVLTGWNIATPTRHTVPLCRGPASLLAIHMASRQRKRMGLALLTQVTTGMRPSETLGILPEHVVPPSHVGSTIATTPLVIVLGAKVGTKVKRQQMVRITEKDQALVEVLERCLAATPPQSPLFPFTLEQYRQEIVFLDKALHFDAGWGAHSPRAGFASDCKIQGVSFTETREAGRWAADTSLRTYLDVVSASGILSAACSRGLAPALAFAMRHWPLYFVEPW